MRKWLHMAMYRIEDDISKNTRDDKLRKQKMRATKFQKDMIQKPNEWLF